jgi:hypothetical protein
MIKRKVRLKITSASRQTIRLSGRGLPVHCPVCGREVEMLTSAEAAGILEVDPGTFDRLVAGGSIHTIQTVSGAIRVCKDSLFLRSTHIEERTDYE